MLRYALLLLLAGCVISPLPAAPPPSPPPPPLPPPVHADSCVEDWYARARLPACVENWITDLTNQQSAIAKQKSNKRKAPR